MACAPSMGLGLGCRWRSILWRCTTGRCRSTAGPATVRCSWCVCRYMPPSSLCGPTLPPKLRDRRAANWCCRPVCNVLPNLSRSLAAYVGEHYAASISREEISAALKVSPNYLSRVFWRDTGMTPWQYLNHYRVVQAQKLLLSSELSVTEVAQHVGFNDPAYFVRVFHKETGKAPLQYRKSAK